jgi:hypothetical protein
LPQGSSGLLWFALMSSISELQAFEKFILQPFELL